MNSDPDPDDRPAESSTAGDAGGELRAPELVPAEILPPEAMPLVIEDAGRVFDASGRLERLRRPPRRPAGGSVRGRNGGAPSLLYWLGRLAGVAALLMVGGAFLVAGGFSLSGAAHWARAHPLSARIGLVAGITFALPLLLPTGPVAILPGYLWGEFEGLVLVLIGAMLGGVLNMLLARHLLGPRVDARVRASPGLTALRRAIGARGFRIALALRMSPVTPYAVVSYLAGLTGLSYLRYGLASVLGGIPWTLVYATAGALLAESRRPVSLDAEVGPAGHGLRILGLVFTLLVAVWIGRAARRELRVGGDSPSGEPRAQP